MSGAGAGGWLPAALEQGRRELAGKTEDDLEIMQVSLFDESQTQLQDLAEELDVVRGARRRRAEADGELLQSAALNLSREDEVAGALQRNARLRRTAEELRGGVGRAAARQQEVLTRHSADKLHDVLVAARNAAHDAARAREGAVRGGDVGAVGAFVEAQAAFRRKELLLQRCEEIGLL